MKHKSEVCQKFKEFETKVTNQSGVRIGTLRTDNGGKYMSKEFQDYLASKGITHELTMPHTPQQNRVAEQMNRKLQESARAMLSHANLPQGYWAEAIAAAAYLRNRVAISPVEQKTPHEMWYGRKPNLSHLGCIAIDIRYHFISEAGQEGPIELQYCPTNDMIADLLTKPLPKESFQRLHASLGLVVLQCSN